MKKDAELLAKLPTFFPAMNNEEKAFLESLPEEFLLECPYHAQEQMHWSGPACAQMIHAFHGRPIPSQEEIARDMGIDDWRFMNHETLEEDFIRFMAKRNFVPGLYFPALYVKPQFKVAEEAGDFMYRHSKVLFDLDQQYFKALLVKHKEPVFMRIHFTTDDYNMPEEMAERIDNVGHAVLLVGYNKDGFVVNDPWDKAQWGGKKGGKQTFISNVELMGPNRPVNSTYDLVATFSPLEAIFQLPYAVPFPNKEITVSVHVAMKGIKGIQSDYFVLRDVQGILRADRNLTIANSVSKCSAKNLLPGDESIIEWSIRTGEKIGSVPLSAVIQATLEIPVRPWERNNGKSETVTIRTEAKTRIDVKDPTWFPLYGMLSK